MGAGGRGDAEGQCQPGTFVSGAGTRRIQPEKMLAVAGSLPDMGTLPSTPRLPARVTPFVPSPCHWVDHRAREEQGDEGSMDYQLFLGLAGRIILINTPIIAAAPEERGGMPAPRRKVLLN